MLRERDLCWEGERDEDVCDVVGVYVRNGDRQCVWETQLNHIILHMYMVMEGLYIYTKLYVACRRKRQIERRVVSITPEDMDIYMDGYISKKRLKKLLGKQQ